MMLWLQLQQVGGSIQKVCMTWLVMGLSLRLQQQQAQQMPPVLQHCSCRHGSGLRALLVAQQLQQLLLHSRHTSMQALIRGFGRMSSWIHNPRQSRPMRTILAQLTWVVLPQDSLLQPRLEGLASLQQLLQLVVVLVVVAAPLLEALPGASARAGVQRTGKTLQILHVLPMLQLLLRQWTL
jgi:hypothetical protein